MSLMTSIAGNFAMGAGQAAAGAIAIRVVPDTSSFGAMLKGGMSSMLGMAGIGGLAAAFGQVISIGNDFTNTLNTLEAVSSATAEQMDAVRARAKELGNDLTIPNTSASNAAEAMTELAKGGFTVEQSMEAAKGTLQLAAAAQISAAEAAGIQSKALQTFGLDASYAGQAADVFANAANASNLEMTDVALGLQAGGTVANQFGLSLEDTSAALALFANVGIRGSDAGTLLKSALLAITDQGKPAREAITDLGLALYDAEGSFVGIESLMQQLGDASNRMTEEQYQQATAVLFGSDAIRFAGIAADDGLPKWQALRDVMDQQGTAAEVAAAKTQGLPGALQQIQNAAENAALELYELIDGPLESLATSAAEKIGQATTAITTGLDGMDTSSYVDAFDNLVGAGEKVVSVGKSIGEALAGGGDEAGTMVEFLTARIENLVSIIAPLASGGAKVLGWFLDLPGPIQATAIAVGLLHHALGPIPMIVGLAATGLTRLASTAVGAAIPGLSGLASMARTAAIGLAAIQGAVAAATLVIAAQMTANSQAEARTDALAEAAKRGAAAQRDLAKAFQESNGEISNQVVGALAEEVKAYQSELETLSDNGGFSEKAASITSFGSIGDVLGGDFGNYKDKWDRLWASFDDSPEDAAQATADALEKVGSSADLVAEKLAASDAEWQMFTETLRATGEGGEAAADRLDGMRENFEETQRTAKDTTRGLYDITDAIKVLSDETATATERADAMNIALDVMAGKPIAVSDALQQYNRMVRDTAEATGEVWDQTKGWGEALLAGGYANLSATENGDRLKDMIDDLRQRTVDAASAGAEMGPIWAQNEQVFQQLERATGLSVVQLKALAAEAGYVPERINLVADLKGADAATQQLVIIRALMESNGEGVDIPVKLLDEEARRRLEEAGIKMQALEDNDAVLHVSAPTEAAVAELQTLIDMRLPEKTLKVNANLPSTEINNFLTEIGNRSVTIPVRPEYQGVAPSNQLFLPGERADGGPITGGVAGKDSVPIMAMPGEHMLTVGDVNALGGQQGVYRFRDALQRGLIGKFEVGGAVEDDAVTRAMTFLRGESGKAYQYGGTGNPSWDCSGFISAGYALVKKLDPYTRWFTTESDFTALGFRPGLDPSGRGLSIGVHNGGGGQYSHMAGTLAGTNFESGVGVMVGSGAAGAADGQFENKYYLAENLFVPPGGSSSGVTGTGRWSDPWDEEDELKLDAARIAVQQAKDDADAALTNPKKSQADRDLAQNKVAQAELKVAEMEAEKAAGGSGTWKDESTDSTTSSSSESDPLNRKSMDEIASSIPELAGNVAKSFVQGQIEDLFGAIGFGGNGAVSKAVTEGISYGQKLEQAKQLDLAKQNETPPTFSDEEIAKQGPVTPGTPGWLEELAKSFRVPAVLRDSGGPLPHGMAALNLSGETEWVSTAQQRRDDMSALSRKVIDGDIAGSISAALERFGAGTAAGPDFSVHIDKVIGHSAADVGRQIAGQQAMQAMRYAGRAY